MKRGAAPAAGLRDALAAQHADWLGKYHDIDPDTYDRHAERIRTGTELHLRRYELDDLLPLPPGDPGTVVGTEVVCQSD